VEVFYELGHGLFDESVARALGIRRRTHGGFVFDPHLIEGDGDPTTPERTAAEGAPEFEIDVPEPSLLLMLVAAGAGSLVRRRRSRAVKEQTFARERRQRCQEKSR
jgi:hypothetical protein